MSGGWGTETDFELTTIERLIALQYTHAIGGEIVEEQRTEETEAVFCKVRGKPLASRYSQLPAESIDEAVRLFARPDGVDTIRRNMAFHKILRSGVEVGVDRPDGSHTIAHVYAVDWDHPEDNI